MTSSNLQKEGSGSKIVSSTESNYLLKFVKTIASPSTSSNGIMILINCLFHGIQLRKHMLQFLRTDFIGNSTTVITLLKWTVLACTLDFIAQSRLDALFVFWHRNINQNKLFSSLTIRKSKSFQESRP